MLHNYSFEEVEKIISQESKSVKIVVTETSMSPYLKAGVDYVIVSPPPANLLGNISRGDIILFKVGDQMKIHRIMHYYGTLLKLRGDGLYGKKVEKMTSSDIIGIVTEGTYRGGKPFRTDSIKWKISAWCWAHTYFIRHQFVRVKRLVRKLFSRKSL